ncbi:hypothetical protein [Streptomyces coeruleorubidus]|uniref:Uncharacterized protein n=1 Tax=Streptomyces coeruleorubidus TaxID=116188 RepID=A0ABZ0KTC5_STRC4|nr:hypothetical protein [Streptomyces coeruleorubidus]WOT40694.1 hypothetical protein R5U08_42145 [Streptomyces coeruleorubidus]
MPVKSAQLGSDPLGCADNVRKMLVPSMSGNRRFLRHLSVLDIVWLG